MSAAEPGERLHGFTRQKMLSAVACAPGLSGAEATASGDRGLSYYCSRRVFVEGESSSSAAERSPCVTHMNGPKIKMMNGKEMLVFVIFGLGKSEDENVERNAGYKKKKRKKSKLRPTWF